MARSTQTEGYRHGVFAAMQVRSSVTPCRGRVLAGAIALALAMSACGEDAQPEAVREPPAEAGHIHGLGIDPADRSLLIATHSGLFRAEPGAGKAERVGDSRQDTMGFTVVGPREYLGSGHPDLRDELPPLLGLIRSNDGGRTWTPVSRLGESDFHALRVAGGTVYGADATSGRLLVSTNGGRTWTARTPPAPLVDLVVDPRDPEHLVATTQDGMFRSRDGGARWRPLDRQLIGLMAWSDALVLVDGEGRVRRSTDAGATWSQVGSIGTQPAAVTADGDALLVATPDNEVRRSQDGGRTWTRLLTA